KTRDTTGKDHTRTEVLWMNRRFVVAQETGRVPIRLTGKEFAEKKLNPERPYSRTPPKPSTQ
ncbi:unnamed protein product, partial [marine sediment metagenome]